MVQLANIGNLRSSRDPRVGKSTAPPVKLEIEDPLEDEHGPLDKRSRISPQWGGAGAGASMAPPIYNLLDEPSPLGLRLRKSPSLLDLIQMRLSRPDTSPVVTASCVTSCESGEKKDLKSTAVSTDKMKASNFPVSLLRIGTWECVSRYEGDLVAKCYFAKHKLVWEVLEGGLKSKIEIQWSDIMALKASCPENGPGSMDIVLARQPLFFRETNPQPRKHTLWQATSDFTGGQASMNRRHFLQCAHGLLNKHFEKLVQCDPRLYALSQQPEITLESPYFDTRCSVFDDQDDSKCHGFDNLKDACGSTVSGFRDLGSPSNAPSVSTTSEARDRHGRTPDNVPRETPSPTSGSVMESGIVDENTVNRTEEVKGSRCWDQFKVPGLRGSMSMCDLVNHIGQCISEQKTPGNPFLSADGSPNKDMLEDLAQYLLSDSQISSGSDEQSLMLRVNSLCCLLQKDGPSVQNLHTDNVDIADGSDGTDDKSCSMLGSSLEMRPLFDLSIGDGEFSDASAYKQPPPSISRKDSFGDLLMHLPRIASLPQVLFNIQENSENQAR